MHGSQKWSLNQEVCLQPNNLLWLVNFESLTPLCRPLPQLAPTTFQSNCNICHFPHFPFHIPSMHPLPCPFQMLALTFLFISPPLLLVQEKTESFMPDSDWTKLWKEIWNSDGQQLHQNLQKWTITVSLANICFT